jgi:hypothetical protein
MLVAGMFLVLSGTAEGQMYECRSTTTPGQVYQQNVPCPPGTDTRPQTRENQLRREKQEKEAAGRAEKEAAGRAENDLAAMRNEVRLGMTPDQVLRAWGYPYRTTTDTATSGSSISWVYRCAPRSTKIASVRFREGKVSNIHWGC